MSGPRFEELYGPAPSPEKRERLEQTHELLVAAGAPPELPPGLQPVPSGSEGRLLPRRRRFALLALAAALGAATFGIGYLVGDQGDGPKPRRIFAMAGTSAAPTARGSLAMFAADVAGNLPIELTIRGLPELAAGGTYELWLTKDGKPVARSGSFVVEDDETAVVPLSTPWQPTDRHGWAVTRSGSTEALLRSSS